MKWAVRSFIVLIILGLLIVFAFHNFLVQKQSFSLRVLHTNDHHAHLESVTVDQQQLGGISRRKTLIDQLRQTSETPTLLLDAGDIFQGTLYFNQYLGKADLPFYNDLNYTAVAVGNHEFDQGQQVLASFLKSADFSMLSANLEMAKKSPLQGQIKPWIIKEIEGEKIGILGLTTRETKTLSSPGEGIEFNDEVIAAKTAVEELEKQDINKIIALTHIGLSQDLKLAEQVDGIDIIIGGHSHTPLGQMLGAKLPYPIVEQTPNGDTILVATDWEWGKYLGDLQVEFDRKGHITEWKGNPHAIDESIQPSAEFEQKLQAFKQPLEKLRQTVIGQTQVKLEGDRAKIRTQETNLGNLIADAMLNQLKVDGADVALVNAGGIRSSIPPGNITLGQVLRVLPFNNTITRLDLTGEQLKQALEHGVSGVEEEDGCFSHVAGIRFSWNPTKPIGDRINSVKIIDKNGTEKSLDLTVTYRVVTNNFMMKGGDGYQVLTQGENQVDTGFLISDVVTEYIKNQSPINLKADNRINLVQSS
ncbi:MAG: 5'-nucleotidase C-terminal domain-containing protein [Microcoleaceae cyanobacterium]